MKNTEPDFFNVDLNELDREWVQQPGLFFGYAQQLADAKKGLEEAKASFDVTRAEISQEIRADPEEYGLEKTTEASINEMVIQQPGYTAEQTAVTECKHKVDILQAAVTALDHRKKALENLVFLHGQNYFSTPHVKGGDKELEGTIKQRAAANRSRRKKKKS